VFSRPEALEDPARAIWAMDRVRPLENTPVTTPSWPMVKDCNVPRAEPSWDSAATLESPANWRSAWGSLVAPKSTAMVPFQAPVAAVGVSVSVGGGLKAGGV